LILDAYGTFKHDDPSIDGTFIWNLNTLECMTRDPPIFIRRQYVLTSNKKYIVQQQDNSWRNSTELSSTVNVVDLERAVTFTSSSLAKKIWITAADNDNDNDNGLVLMIQDDSEISVWNMDKRLSTSRTKSCTKNCIVAYLNLTTHSGALASTVFYKHNRVYLGTHRGELSIWKLDVQQYYNKEAATLLLSKQIDQSPINRIFVDHHDDVWMFSKYGHIRVLHANNQKVTHLKHYENFLFVERDAKSDYLFAVYMHHVRLLNVKDVGFFKELKLRDYLDRECLVNTCVEDIFYHSRIDRIIIAAGCTRQIVVWNFKSNTHTRINAHDETIKGLAITSMGYLITGSVTGELKVWNPFESDEFSLLFSLKSTPKFFIQRLILVEY
jgi:hypothetical protein